MSVNKAKCLDQKIRYQGLRSPKMRSLLVVNEQFEDEHNEDSGLYGQTLIKYKTISKFKKKLLTNNCMILFVLPSLPKLQGFELVVSVI